MTQLKHYIINVKINVEEGIALEEGEGGDYGTCQIGQPEIEYNEQTRNLEIYIPLQHFEMKSQIGDYEGSGWDRFSGIVSKDGKTWQTSWTRRLEMENFPPEFSNETEVKKLTFKKDSP